MKNQIEGNPRMQHQDIKDEDEAIYQCHDFQRSQQLLCSLVEN
jgi:hypothetical protein